MHVDSKTNRKLRQTVFCVCCSRFIIFFWNFILVAVCCHSSKRLKVTLNVHVTITCWKSSSSSTHFSENIVGITAVVGKLATVWEQVQVNRAKLKCQMKSRWTVGERLSNRQQN